MIYRGMFFELPPHYSGGDLSEIVYALGNEAVDKLPETPLG
jgi:hypothetical protein